MTQGFDIVKAGHIEYLVRDLEAARRFYVDTLGFVLTESDSSHLYLRGIEDRHHHCLVLTKSDSPGVGHLAFRVRNEDDLAPLAKLLGQKGSQSEMDRGRRRRGPG